MTGPNDKRERTFVRGCQSVIGPVLGGTTTNWSLFRFCPSHRGREIKGLGLVNPNMHGIRNTKLGDNMFGDQEHQQLAREALPLLIEKAKVRDTIKYGDLAGKLEIAAYDYPMSQMLGSIVTTLYELGQEWQEEIPHITALVVRASTGYPSYPPNTSNEVFDKEFQRIYDYRKWDAVQKILLSDSLPKLELHPVIAQGVLPIFETGRYDSAVFEAFKQVEIAVRKAGGYTDGDIGTDLMRKAFHTNDGNLTDQNQRKGEKQARSDLFAGAIGSYKNPGSHRNVKITAEEATEIIIFASHLLRIVDSCNHPGSSNSNYQTHVI